MAQGKVKHAERCPFCSRRRLITPVGWPGHLKAHHPQVPSTTPHPSRANAASLLAESLRNNPPPDEPPEEPRDEDVGGDGGDDAGPTPEARQDKPPKGEKQAPPKAMSLKDAALLSLLPRRFETTTALLWLAKEVTEREWGWEGMEPGDWLDNYLYWSMRDYGYVLGGYQKLATGEEDGRHTRGPEAPPNGGGSQPVPARAG